MVRDKENKRMMVFQVLREGFQEDEIRTEFSNGNPGGI